MQRMVTNNVEPLQLLFVVGAPRSGTTLLYQLLATRFAVSYFNNFTARFTAAPLLGQKLWRWFPAKKASGDFESTHGRTSGLAGPHEGGPFWYRWFPAGEQVYVGPGEILPAAQATMRAELIGWQQYLQKPLLFKNTFNAMRLAPLQETFPEAVFLVCHRDPMDTAQSILRARQAVGTLDSWWSVPPRELYQIQQKPYWEQVVEQVYYIEQQIETDRRHNGSGRFFDIQYERLCQEPALVLDEIARFAGGCGVKLEETGEVPDSFRLSTGRKIAFEDYERMQAKVAALWR
ncbi:MAG: sulfotransferase [Anaerolineales bacterium]|nr:sulfotransferase [Anaerolineales bacterium]